MAPAAVPAPNLKAEPVVKERKASVMEMKPVQSSNIAAVGHEGRTLRVQFKNGTTYEYANVPAKRFTDLLAARSVGKHFARQIRGQFTYRKLDLKRDRAALLRE